MTRATDLIAAERQRQIDECGYTPEKDMQYPLGELARAGTCYADDACQKLENVAGDQPHPFWPWPEWTWKPEDVTLTQLVKAGALIAAEIDTMLGPEDA